MANQISYRYSARNENSFAFLAEEAENVAQNMVQ